MEERSVRVRLGQMIVSAAALLLVASAAGLLGTWALGVGLVVIVGASVVTAIVLEEREVPAPAPAVVASQVPRGR